MQGFFLRFVLKNKSAVLCVASVLFLLAPIIALGIDTPAVPTTQITDVWALMVNILKFIWPLFIGIAIFMFVFSGFLFLTAQGDQPKLQMARSSLIWAVVGVIVATLAFSIPFIIQNVITSETVQQLPEPKPEPVPRIVTGACLDPVRGCVIETADACINAPGTYLGDDTTCP